MITDEARTGEEQARPPSKEASHHPLRGLGPFITATGMSVAVVLVVGCYLTAASGSDPAKLVGNVGQLLASALAALACFRASRRQALYARGWFLMGISAGIWSAAAGLWLIYGISRDNEYPFPSLADIGFLGYALPAGAALLAFPTGRTRLVSRLRTLLDGLVIASGTFFVSWALALGASYRSSSSEGFAHLVGLAYPVVDVVIAALVLVLGMRKPQGSRLPFALLGTGLVLLSVTDSIFVARTLNGELTTGTVVATGWIVCWLAVVLATLAPTAPPVEAARHLNPVQELIPYVAVVLAGLVAAGRSQAVQDDPVLLVIGLLTVALVALRQVIVTTEHSTLLTERQQSEVALAAARDEALAASRAKSEFLATMSHEIRTPMNGVIGLTGLLLDTQLTETQRHYAEGVRGSGEALLGIINDILDFSKIEAGKLELETVDFDLSHAVEEVAALVSESARAKNLELVAYCRPEVPTALRGDVGRLRQILLNFATNAVKFTEAGEVVVRASLSEELTGGQVLVRLEVTDTGVGVGADTAGRLFEPFSQADASTTRRYGGTGLGLAICRRLAEAMGGTVGVDSQPGQGSTFWLCLPLERASAPLGSPDGANHWLEACRVLVVDDNQTNRLVLASQLRAWDIAVDVACDGEEALDRLREAAAGPRPYDLALLDMCMPVMNGLDLARRVRADPHLESVRLLLLSSVAIDAEAAAEAGCVARLTKPVRLSTLYDAMVRAVAPVFEAAAEPTPTVAVASRGTLLIVEDHAINQEVAKGIVAKLGYGADVAGDGIEALQALELRSYAAVLMDCHMPLMDGFQATAEIRRREAGRGRVPIIAMTAGALIEDREKCLAAGMDDYLSKPVKVHELEVMLDKWLPGDHAKPDLDSNSSSSSNGNGETGTNRAGVLDAAQFDGLRQLAAVSSDPGFLRKFLEQYLDEASSQLAQLREA